MNASVSIVICTYNGSKRLRETLCHLAAQKVPSGIPWEVVVIDNASTDDTADVAKQHEALLHPVPLRIAFEPKPGLSNARQCGIREARCEIISMVDDDNWVAPDWVERVHRIFTEHPEIDVLGGRVEGVYEIEPPSWMEALRGWYAIGSQHARNGDVTDAGGTLLWGAGLNVRASAIRRLFEAGFDFQAAGRKGKHLTSGEDTEICFALRESGSRFWYDDGLVLKHFIPKERLTWSYPLRLMRGMGQTSVILELYLNALDRPPFDNRAPWKKGWLFAALRASRRFFPVVLQHPLECLQQPEGSIAALNFKRELGRWAGLWALFGRYSRLRDEISNAKWVRAESQG
jgi:glycosyltransferase involved in cell wall biosynthesis